MLRYTPVLALLMAAAAALAQPAPPPGGLPPGGAPAGGMPAPTDISGIARKFLDLPYASLSKAQTLDIYLPDRGAGPFPVLVSIHGGGFAFGDARGAELALALRARERGYAVVGVNYRLSGETTFPAAVQDVKAAIRFLRAGAATWNLDPGRFAVWGSSAGGNIAALAGTSAGAAVFLDPRLGNASVPDRVQAVVDWFGPVDFLSMDREFAASGVAGQAHGTADSFESRYLGAPIASVPDKVALSNPATWIDPGDPPFFIQHGEADTNIPTRQSIDLATALAKAIGPGKVRLETIPGAGHGGPPFETAANLAKVLDFLDSVLK